MHLSDFAVNTLSLTFGAFRGAFFSLCSSLRCSLSCLCRLFPLLSHQLLFWSSGQNNNKLLGIRAGGNRKPLGNSGWWRTGLELSISGLNPAQTPQRSCTVYICSAVSLNRRQNRDRRRGCSARCLIIHSQF